MGRACLCSKLDWMFHVVGENHFLSMSCDLHFGKGHTSRPSSIEHPTLWAGSWLQTGQVAGGKKGPVIPHLLGAGWTGEQDGPSSLRSHPRCISRLALFSRPGVVLMEPETRTGSPQGQRPGTSGSELDAALSEGLARW